MYSPKECNSCHSTGLEDAMPQGIIICHKCGHVEASPIVRAPAGKKHFGMLDTLQALRMGR